MCVISRDYTESSVWRRYKNGAFSVVPEDDTHSVSKHFGQVQVLVVTLWTFKAFYLNKCVIAGLSAIL